MSRTLPHSLARSVPTLGLLALITCGGLDTFTIEESATTTQQGATIVENLVGDLGFSDFATMDISSNQKLENEGVKRNQIDSVFLRSLTLTITDPPSGQDFTFMDSLAFFAEAEGLDRVRIASGGPFDAGLTSIGLDVDDVDLAPYAAAPAMEITTEVTGRRPQNDTTIEATLTLDVDVDVSGALCGD